MLFVKYNNTYPASEILALIVITLIAGYFALRVDTDPESCLANDESNLRYISG